MNRIKILLAGMVLVTAANATLKAQTPEQMLEKLGIELFKPAKPAANYTRAVQTGNLVFLAGHGPLRANGTSIKGRLGDDLTLEEGQEAARIAAISLLSTLKEEIGDLSRVKRIVKVTGMVNCTADFYDQSKVINGCSDLLVEVFGEKGKHARAAVGMVSLPFNIAVEIEMIVEIK
ncbi:RidA family protein [Fulvivirga kasyanovii]|uniref:RidA family protein n=1 Tax=Fulvivirga kasyanovii TaxID=396812 RepID=A0ABW9RXP1_9BACT|nr:RidA family protein [Fulvivirga kasyanovii]